MNESVDKSFICVGNKNLEPIAFLCFSERIYSFTEESLRNRVYHPESRREDTKAERKALEALMEVNESRIEFVKEEIIKYKRGVALLKKKVEEGGRHIAAHEKELLGDKKMKKEEIRGL